MMAMHGPLAHHRIYDGADDPHDNQSEDDNREVWRKPEYYEGYDESQQARGNLHETSEPKLLCCLKQPAKPCRQNHDGDRQREKIERLHRLGFKVRRELNCRPDQPGRRNGQSHCANAPKREHEVPGCPKKAVDVSACGGWQQLSSELGDRSPQAKIEQTKVADDHPSQCEHTEPFDAKAPNDERNCRDTGNRRDHLGGEAPERAGGQKPAIEEAWSDARGCGHLGACRAWSADLGRSCSRAQSHALISASGRKITHM